MSELAIVVSGLPASGKSSVGKKLAVALGIPFLDKDDYLEELFEKEGVGDQHWRLTLSQKSNVHFQRAAVQNLRVVLVSHWRALGDECLSGTPTEWLDKEFDRVVEVYCRCPADYAVCRFVKRNRHVGHCDKDRKLEEIKDAFTQYSKKLPMQLGELITIDTRSFEHIDDTIESFVRSLG